MAVDDATFGEVIRGHLNRNGIAHQHPDTVLPHTAGGVRKDLMAIVEHHAEHRIWQHFHHFTVKL